MHIISLNNIKIASINQKYNYNPKTGKLFLSKPYRDFKNLIILNATRKKIEAPYAITIEVETYNDIDSFCKPLLDGLEKAGVIDNDKSILKMHIYKTQIKRGQPNKLDVWVETI